LYCSSFACGLDGLPGAINLQIEAPLYVVETLLDEFFKMMEKAIRNPIGKQE